MKNESELLKSLDLLNKAVKGKDLKEYKSIFYQLKHYILRHICKSTPNPDFWTVEFCKNDDDKKFYEVIIHEYCFHIPKEEFPGVIDWNPEKIKHVDFKPEIKEIDEEEFCKILDNLVDYYIKINGISEDKKTIYNLGTYMICRFFGLMYKGKATIKPCKQSESCHKLDSHIKVLVDGKVIGTEKNYYRFFMTALMNWGKIL